MSLASALAIAGPYVAALFFSALGIAAMARPHRLLSGFGIDVRGADGANEIRAVYGGFPLGVAGLLLISQFEPDHSSGILLTIAVAAAAMAAGRLASALIDRRIGRLPALFTLFELAIAGLICAGFP